MEKTANIRGGGLMFRKSNLHRLALMAIMFAPYTFFTLTTKVDVDTVVALAKEDGVAEKGEWNNMGTKVTFDSHHLNLPACGEDTGVIVTVGRTKTKSATTVTVFKPLFSQKKRVLYAFTDENADGTVDAVSNEFNSSVTLTAAQAHYDSVVSCALLSH